jgi:hypothetical protein
MVEHDAQYGFNMLHPQTIPQFLTGLWESFDEFLSEANAGKYSTVKHLPNRDSKGTVVPPFKPLSLLPFPRNLGIHYWDNFEVFSLASMEERVPLELRAVVAPHEEDGWGVLDYLGSSIPADEPGWRLLLSSDTFSASLRRVAADGWRALVNDRGFILRLQEEVRRLFNHQVARHNERRATMQRFLSFVDRKGGFYYHRWGDAEVRTLLVALVFDPNEIVYFDSLPYQHYFNFHCPENATGCEEFARQENGNGNKQRGTARMAPAEMSNVNAVFAKHQVTTGGWKTV